MNSTPVINVGRLPTISFGNTSMLWTGAIGLILIEGTMFAILIATYFYLRLGFAIWPPSGIRLEPVTWPSINLGIMILSCVPAYLATEAAKRNDKRAVVRWLVWNIALALVALVVRIVIWNHLNFKWSSNVYGSIIWVILELHTLDYVIGLLETVALLGIIHWGGFGEKQRMAVDIDSVTWYFVVAIWIPLYAVVYWGAYMVPGH